MDSICAFVDILFALFLVGLAIIGLACLFASACEKPSGDQVSRTGGEIRSVGAAAKKEMHQVSEDYLKELENHITQKGE